MQHDVRATYIYHTHVTNVGFFGKFILTVKTMKSTGWWAHPVSTQEKEEMETVGSFAILILKSREQFIVW